MDKLFYTLSFLTLASALMVVLSKHPIRSILFLVVTFFLISAHYILLNAQFLALVNVVVYAGAIMVLFLFVVMFLNLNQEIERFKNWVPLGAAVISGGCIFLVFLSAYKSSQQIEIDHLGNYQIGLIENLGNALYRDYLLPMEICSILFLVAMIGIVLLSRKEKLEFPKNN
ncbi:MAG: NADH-quinone oxidoreductase subunit J [Saprospiraceae bacterium]|nr:NADH-quinone oxidoreductase subunit J [Saprospiraceae bacterium]MBK8450818.1 NADH-quinone oxidoreductase subunit J [Saprospiraceae bacterium]MBK8485101.1 NADH-quinone oxidoreductase subunit J [Saprospiraceae bacterium]MBK9720628.1 NADH-quinone oxidoreductase subunit J [Saprospiraceae bacterium]MBK9727617.1 NADH-quinone oxidoreductase subunit J [Saprospiraceae bacterium]